MRNVHSRIYAQSFESHPAPAMNSAPLLPLPISVPSPHPASPSREESQRPSVPAFRAASQTCRYAGKECTNLRATKRNGSLHNLCERHRIRANRNQCRMAHRIHVKQDRAHVALSARYPGAGNAVAAVGNCWAMAPTVVEPRWEESSYVSASTTPYSPSPRHMKRDMSTDSPFEHRESLQWRHTGAFPASGGGATEALHRSYFEGKYLWPEPAPIRHEESYVWSDQRAFMAMSASTMHTSDYERSSIV